MFSSTKGRDICVKLRPLIFRSKMVVNVFPSEPLSVITHAQILFVCTGGGGVGDQNVGRSIHPNVSRNKSSFAVSFALSRLC